MRLVNDLQRRARWVQRDTYALVLACRDPRTPRLAKIIAAAGVAYALSPIDLIPDFIPILGSLDDLIIVPFAFGIAIRMIPPEVMIDCRARANVVVRRTSRAAAAVIITIWVLFALFVLYLVARATGLITQ